ncbi:MAG TPA: hypothetical protein VL860_14815, partial [Planctomycetota bacterium]|nr:hypothetical protein [Planctomycetota bacterium]
TLLVPLDPEHFRILLRAVIAFHALEDRPLTGAMDDPQGGSVNEAVLADVKEWRRQVALGAELAQSSLNSANPVRQYFGVVVARSLFAIERLPELLKLSESDNARVQAESLEAIAALIHRRGFADAKLDHPALLRSARAGLSAKSMRTRLAAALALQEMPADGVARDLMTFYRDAADECFKLKAGDEKRAIFIDQRDRFWLSPALLQDPAAEEILLDFAASNDGATATGALGVLGLRGSASSIPGLVEMLGEKDFKYGSDAKIALFRIALSDEILQHTVDLKSWAATVQKQTYLERLEAGLKQVERRLSPKPGDKFTDDELSAAVLLASCMPGETSLPVLIHQTSVPFATLPPVVFARTQTPLAFPYLGCAILTGSDEAVLQSEMSLRGWAALEPLVRFACDGEIGAAAARHTRYGDNPGLDACADLTPPDAAYGVIAGIPLDTATRNRGRRFQILQSFTGQSYGWGENEVEWNTTLCYWAQFRSAQDRQYQFGRPPALRQWLCGAQEQLGRPGAGGATLAGDTLKGWVHDLASPDPRVARAAWRNLAVAGMPPSSMGSSDASPSPVRAEIMGLLAKVAQTDGPLSTRLLSVNLLGFLRAPVARTLIPLLGRTVDPGLRHQLWWALSRAGGSETLPAEMQSAILTLIQKTAAGGADPVEQALAVWALCDLPNADAVAGMILADDGFFASAQRAAAAVLLYRACRRPTTATIVAIARGLSHVSDDRLHETLMAALAANQGDLTPARREARLVTLAHALSTSTSANYDEPAGLLRVELEPQPYAGPAAYSLSPATLEVLHDGFAHALAAASASNDPAIGDASDRAYGWALATGGWPGREFLDLQSDGLDPFGKSPVRRARTAAHLMEGILHAGGTVPAPRLRSLMSADDDRLAGYAAFMLARLHVDDDIADIFSRFNRAVPKTQIWLNAVAATSSPDAYKFLTDTAKSAG